MTHPARNGKARDERLLISVERLASIFRYDPATGDFFWRTQLDGKGHPRRPDMTAGCVLKSGYRVLSIETDAGTRTNIMAHRAAWALMTGEWPAPGLEIDHKNGFRASNQWTNLRLVSRLKNGKNKGLRRSNRYGLKGVTYRARCANNPWRAQILVDGRKICLGHYKSAIEAALTYDKEAVRLHGDYARTNAQMGLL